MDSAQNMGYDFYNTVLGKPKHILAPMVEQSELAFRMLLHDYGAQLFYTPMWHAGIFVKDAPYRKAALDSCPEDRPLIVQFCANDPEIFAAACALAEPHCDAIDLNLGCPQVIAKRGHYGAYLMEEIERVEKMISTATKRISKPITCKIRIFNDIQQTVQYAKRMEKAGAKIITVHGRLREQRGPLTGLANWDHIKAVKENLQIPVFANGNIQYLSDVEKCLQFTNVDGVMSAEGALYNPAIFMGRQPPVWEVASQYLAYAEKYPAPVGSVRGHLFRMWHHCLCKHSQLRLPMGTAKSFAELKLVSEQLTELCKTDAEKDIADGLDSEQAGSIPYWRCQPYVRPPQKGNEKQAKRLHCQIEDESKENLEEEKRSSDKPLKVRKLKKIKNYIYGKGIFPNIPRDKWPLCKVCRGNPYSEKCNYIMCRKCCRDKCSIEILDCPGHRNWFIKQYTRSNTYKKNEQQQQICIHEINQYKEGSQKEKMPTDIHSENDAIDIQTEVSTLGACAQSIPVHDIDIAKGLCQTEISNSI